MMASCLSGAIYVDLQEDYKSLPKGIWVFWLFAAFSWINAYIIKVAAYSNFLNPELIGGSLGSSFLFTLAFGIGSYHSDCRIYLIFGISSRNYPVSPGCIFGKKRLYRIME